MHEILTLQFGQRSNYLATHFWNTQESYFTYSTEKESIVDHDIHFRPGIGADGSETFTPRTVIYDLKGGFGSMKKINALYEVEEPVAPQGLWNGPTIVQRQTAVHQNEYQQSLDAGLEPPQLTTQSVRYWSDFSRVFYHPRSIVQLNEYELNSSLMPFENWGAGEDLFNSLDKEHDLLDRDLRPFAEEADQLQGIQIMSGIDDAWGGFAARYIDRIRDEYGKTAVCVWGSEDDIKSIPREKRFSRSSNTARSLFEVSSQASLFVPITLPSSKLPDYIQLDSRSEWHKSALFMTALETITLASRLKVGQSNHETLSQLQDALNINGNQNIARLKMSVIQESSDKGTGSLNSLGQQRTSLDPRVGHAPKDIHEFDSDNDDEAANWDVDFFPSEAFEIGRGRRVSKKTHTFGTAENFRVGESNEHTGPQEDEDVGFERARRRAAGSPLTRRTKIPLLFPVLDSFPHIYTHEEKSPVLQVNASLSTDTSVAVRLKWLQQSMGRAIGLEDREAITNGLGEMAEAYEEGWDSGSDDGDDED